MRCSKKLLGRFLCTPVVRLQVLVLLLIALLLANVRLWWIDPALAGNIIRYCGYWVCLVLMVATLWFLLKALPVRKCRTYARVHWIGLVISLSGGLFYQLHEPHRLKVLFDEFGFSGIAYNMHFGRNASFPARAHFFNGRLNVLNHGIDKRSLLFPFLISVVHDLSGYRVVNVYILNAVLACALLLIVYLCCEKLGGKTVGWWCQLLLIGLPLLAQCATGGGYDILNMVLVAALFLATYVYLRAAGVRGLNLMITVALLLAYVRYESILYVAVPVAAFLYKLIRVRVVRLTWFSVLAPITLVIPVCINLVMMSSPVYFENKPGQAVFAFSYVRPNIEKAVYYLFQMDLGSTNSVPLAIIGVLAAAFSLVRAISIITQKRKCGDADILMMSMGSVLIINLCIIMANFWSNWDDPMASRFSLTTYLFFVLAFAYIANEFFSRGRRGRIATGLLAVYVFGVAVPASASAGPTKDIVAGDEYAWFDEIIKTKNPGDVLIVGPGYIGAIINGYPAISAPIANLAPWKIKLCMNGNPYKEILVMERIFIDSVTLREYRENLALLSSSFVLQTVSEQRFRPDVITRISKIVDVTGDQSKPPAEFTKKGPPFKSTYDYAINYIDRLP